MFRDWSTYANHYILYHTYGFKHKSHMILSGDKEESLFKKNATFLYDKSLNENRESKNLTST